MNIIILLISTIFGSTCPEHFWLGKEPSFTKPVLQVNRDRELCFQGFAIYHSGTTLTPLWSAEHLTAQAIENARSLHRDNEFHEEEQLPEKYRSWLSDYFHSGYDRGHLAASANFGNMQAQHESFSLANMIPQNRELNRGIWERIERSVRLLAMRDGELYVITGPLFEGQIQRIGRVQLPSHVWKLIFDPKFNAGAVYLCTNTDTDQYSELTISQFESISGINFNFGGINRLELPKPKRRKSRDLY